jgi:hypothetical protein
LVPGLQAAPVPAALAGGARIAHMVAQECVG